MKLEGGFQGRTNKLVDSCYSYWQGAAGVLIQRIRKEMSDVDLSGGGGGGGGDGDMISSRSIITPSDDNGDLIINQLKLQQYILLCAQQQVNVVWYNKV